MNINLSNDEAKALVNLLDAAVKAVGLPAAEAALFFAKKIDAAFSAKDAPVDSQEFVE